MKHRCTDDNDQLFYPDEVSERHQGGLINIGNYQPSRRAVTQVARDFEETFVDLNHALIQMDAAHNLSRRASLCVTSTHAFGDQLSTLVPSARGAINRIIKEQEDDTIDILRNWRRDRYDR